MSRIVIIQGFSMRARLREPFEWPDGFATHRVGGAVRIETDDGVVGWGPCGPGWTPGLTDQLSDLLVGRSPEDTWSIWHDLKLRKVPMSYVGGVDIALWDIKGKMAGKPIHALLGGALRDKVVAYATGGYYLYPVDSPEWLRAQVLDAVVRGFHAYKMKVGARDIASDLARVDLVKQILGPKVDLAVDATTTYNLQDAARMGRELESRNILWYEDPLPAHDIEGYKHLTRTLHVPVTAHCGARENILPQLLRERAVHQVQPAIDAMGGFSMAMPTIGAASLAGISLVPACWSTHLHMAATLHFLAVIPSLRNCLDDVAPMLEFDTSENPLRDESILAQPIAVEPDGTVAVPQGPGLGVEVIEDKVRRYAVGAV